MNVSRAKRILIAWLACLATAGIATSATDDDGLGFENLDFERGTEPWAIYYGEDPEAPRFPWGLDADVVKSGKASLRIVACDYQGRATVHQSTAKLVPGRRYRVAYWIKVSDPDMAVHCDLKLNFRKPKADGQGEDLVSVVPAMLSEAGENGWSVRRGTFAVDKEAVSAQIALCVRDAVGTVWFDDVHLQDAGQAEVRVESIYHYAPEQVEIGPAMVDRFFKVVQSRPELIERAKVYNQRLVDVAQLTEQSRRLQRASGYLEEGGQTADISDELSVGAQIEAKLDQLHQTYSRLLLAKTPPEPGEFDRSAEALSQAIKAARDQIASKLRALQETARRAGADWSAPEETPARPIAIAPDGTPNQLVFGKVSLQSHYALEEPLAVNRLAHTPLMEIKGEGLGKYDFGSLLVSWSYLQKLGARQSALGTPFAVHSNQVAPEWFLDKYGDDPDIFMRGADGTRALRPSWSFGAPLNTWRPEVREMTTDLITQIGRTLRDQPQYLWYVVAPENGGPYFPSERDMKSTGYNASALPDFHAWLERRYGEIGNLNRQWQTEHARFEDIRPPDDLLIVNEWPRPHPLGYEFQCWRLDHHHEWLKLLYDSFKKADPGKPVMADHSSLLSRVDGSRIFETADVLSFHDDRDFKSLLGMIYLHSMNRFAGKQLGLHENMWACQEDAPLTSDERIQRAILTKYLSRLAAWGMHVQMWWYAYTSNDYMVRYNGNWFDPVLDLTTLRYSAAGLPVGKDKLKRLEEVVLQADVAPAPILILQPNTAMLFQNYWGESYSEMIELHKLLFQRNNLYELLPETYFTDGRAKLDDYRVVVLPYAPYFPDRLADLLEGWVERGGLLVAVGPCGLYDKFGFDQPDLWIEAFGPRLPRRLTKPYPYYAQNRDWRWQSEGVADGGPDVLETSLGKGKVMVVLRSLQNPGFRKQAAPRMLQAIEAAAPRAARCASNQFEMTIHQTPQGAKYLWVVNADVSAPVTDTVTLAGLFRRGIDLDVPGGFPVPFCHDERHTSFRLSLQPGEFTLIALD